MARKILGFAYDYKKTFAEYTEAVKQGKLYKATLLFNRLRAFNFPEVLVRHSTIVGRLGLGKEELNYLLRVLARKEYREYNKVAVCNRIGFIFKFFFNRDVKDYYNGFLKRDNEEEIELKLGKKEKLRLLK